MAGAEETLTWPCSTGIRELILVNFCLDYFPLLPRGYGAVMSNGLGRMGWLCGRIENNFGWRALRCGVLSLGTLFFSPLLFGI